MSKQTDLKAVKKIGEVVELDDGGNPLEGVFAEDPNGKDKPGKLRYILREDVVLTGLRFVASDKPDFPDSYLVQYMLSSPGDDDTLYLVWSNGQVVNQKLRKLKEAGDEVLPVSCVFVEKHNEKTGRDYYDIEDPE